MQEINRIIMDPKSTAIDKGVIIEEMAQSIGSQATML